MKPIKLTARSRRRIRTRLAREWFDCSNDIAHWQSEKDFAECQNDRCAASWANMRLAFAERRLAQIEHKIESF